MLPEHLKMIQSNRNMYWLDYGNMKENVLLKLQIYIYRMFIKGYVTKIIFIYFKQSSFLMNFTQI
jgi:hypothetical protein